MKKRIKKKQSRLVAKWLADNPEYKPLKLQPITHSIREYIVTPQKFYAKQDFSRFQCEHFPNQNEWNAFVRHELARHFMDIVTRSIRVEKSAEDDMIIQYAATLDIIPYTQSKQEIDEMYEQQERDAFAEFGHMLSSMAREKELDKKVRMVRFNQTHGM